MPEVISHNLPSTAVAVFPSARRANASADYKSSRIVGEKSIVNGIKNVLPIPSYIISDAFAVGVLYKFIIEGYYFEIIIESNDILLFNSTTAIYAKIAVTGDEPFPELDGVDNAINKYTGLTLTDTVTNTDKYLKILENTGTSTTPVWAIPKESKYRIYYNNIQLTEDDVIDCGIVTAGD